MPQRQKDRNRLPRNLACFAAASLLAPALAGCTDILGDYKPSGCNVADCTATWARSFGDGDEQRMSAIAMSPEGDVVMVGWFNGSVDFGGGPHMSAGMGDIFVAKVDAGGNYVWSHRYGNQGHDQATAVAIDPDGNILVTGEFTQTMDFGGFALQGQGLYDIFVAKLSSKGEVQWASRYGDGNNQEARAIATDKDGNVFVTGCILGAVDFGGGPRGALTTNAFALKLDSGGAWQWDKEPGGNGSECGERIAAGEDGNVFVAGTLTVDLDYGTGSLKSEGAEDIFVAGLDASSGDPRWVLGFGDPSAQLVGGLVVTLGAGVALTGSTAGTVDFEGHPVATKDLDPFVAFFDPGGAVAGAAGVSEGGPQQILSSAVDANDNILLSGNENPDAVSSDIYLASVSPKGALVWSKTFPGPNKQYGKSVLAGPGGTLILGGDFTGKLELPDKTLDSAGTSDLFLTKLAPPAANPP